MTCGSASLLIFIIFVEPDMIRAFESGLALITSRNRIGRKLHNIVCGAKSHIRKDSSEFLFDF